MRVQREHGSLKHIIACVGIGVRTLLVMTILPAVLINLFNQPLTLVLILSTMEVKRSLFLQPKCSGSPKYLPMPPSLGIWMQSFIMFFRERGAFLEKLMEDLVVLIDYLNASSYCWRISFRASVLSLLALAKNMVSSVNRRWFTWGQPRATVS